MRELDRPCLPTARARQSAILSCAALACAAVAFGLLSIAARQDTNWDLRNYHLYVPWALLNGRLNIDLAPAQLQTYFNPVLDLPFYAMVVARWPARLVAFVMGLPAGVATFALAKVFLHLFAALPPAKRWLCTGLACLGGLTATMPVALLGSTMNEWQVSMLVVLALWAIVTHPPVEAQSRWPYWVGGMLAGTAAGLKLSSAHYAVGLAIAILFFDGTLRNRIAASIRCAAGVAIGLALSLGPWAWALMQRFGNPVYPFFNDVFGSPWWDPVPVAGHAFGPRTWFDWLTFPVRMAFTSEMYVTERPIRDARFAFVFVAMLLAAIARWRSKTVAASPPEATKREGEWRFMLAFFVVSLVVWAAMYSILRYAMALQLLATGLTIDLLRRWLPARWLPLAATAVVAMSIATTRYVSWGRADFRDEYIEVEVPRIAPGSAVLLISDEPMAYVIPSFGPAVRFAGLENNLVNPWRKNRMQDAIRSMIDGHAGPLYSLNWPAGAGDQVLRAYGLRKVPGPCDEVRANMPKSPLELCRLEKRTRDG